MRLKSAGSAVLATSLLIGGSVSAAGLRSATPSGEAGSNWRLAASTIAFEANRGQTDRSVRFVSRTPDAVLFLTGREAVWRIAGAAGSGADRTPRASAGRATMDTLRMSFAGASYSSEPFGEGPLPRATNYLTGSDPARWRTGVPSFSRIRYPGVYPGVDLVFHDRERQMEFDFLVQPGADPGRIRLRFPDVRSAEIDARGDLRLTTRGGDRRFSRPSIYQETENGRAEVAGNFVISSGDRAQGLTVAFHVDAYDRSKPLVIDPTLLYATYLGGVDDDQVHAIASDAAGNAYVTGRTFALEFPGVDGSALQPALGGVQDAFVTKINAAGTAIVYSTYLGGSDSDLPSAIAVDNAGAAYIAGQTNSTDFPGTSGSAIQPHNAGDYDAFVAKLDPAGSTVVFATYLGTPGYEDAHGIAVGPSRNVYVVGESDSAGFPGTSVSPIQSATKGGGFDAFVSEINSEGSAIVYSTYLGGTGADYGFGIAVDRRANAYVTGATTSADFIAAAASSIRAGLSGPLDPGDAYVAKIAPAGASLLYSTYLGGENSDYGVAIALDPVGGTYVTGVTGSTLFTGASASAIQPHLRGGSDGFLAKIDPDGEALVYSTYLGGSEGDVGVALAVDPSGRAYVAGGTASPDFPGTAGNPIQGQYGDGSDAYFAVVDAEGSRILFSTYLGGASEDLALGIALDGSGNILVGGGTLSAGFPGATQSPIQASLRQEGGQDGFVAKISALPPSNPARRRAIPVDSVPPALVGPR